MRMKNCTTLAKFEKFLITINDMPHQLSAVRLQTRDIYRELRKYLYKEHSNVLREDFWVTKIGLWIDTQSCADNTLYDNGKNSGKKLLQIEKQAESSDGNFICHVFSQDAVAHVIGSSPSETVTIKK